MTKHEVAEIIRTMANEDDETLDRFMQGYIIGTVAGHYIDLMTAPGQRQAFLENVRAKYPHDFQPVGKS